MSRRSALDIALDHPGYPRLVPHKYALATPEEWFDGCGLLLRRHVVQSDKLDDVCADLGLTPEFGAYMVGFVTRQGATRVGKHFGRSISGDPIPPLPVRESIWLNANDIGRAIYKTAQRRIYVVREIVSVFAAAASSDKQLVLSITSRRHLHFARVFRAFVRGLKIADLQIGLVAYKDKHGVHADLDALAGQLGLSQDSPKRLENARNLVADSPTRQAGIEVVRIVGSASVVDQAFFSSMVLGAAVEPWRFTLPVASAPTAGASDQQVPNPAKTIDPESKMPPASAIEGIEETQPEVILHGS